MLTLVRGVGDIIGKFRKKRARVSENLPANASSTVVRYRQNKTLADTAKKSYPK